MTRPSATGNVSRGNRAAASEPPCLGGYVRTGRGIAVATALLGAVLCSRRDTLFTPDQTRLVRPYAFLSRSLDYTATLADTGSLEKTATVYPGDTLLFLGLVSGSSEHTSSWTLGDGRTSADTIVTHAYVDSGTFTALFTVSDSMGNSLSDSVRVLVLSRRTAPPTITVFGPTGVVNTRSPRVHAAFTGDAAGINTARTILDVGGVDVTSGVRGTPDGIEYYPQSPLPDGVYPVRLSVADSLDNAKTLEWSFFVDATRLTCAPDTTIRAGESVAIRARASGVFSRVEIYKWDYDGNGSWDDSLATADTSVTRSRVYAITGKFSAVVLMRDDRSIVRTDTVVIVVAGAGPVIQRVRTDTTLVAGDSVLFTASAVDFDGSIVEYRWDFDGNGSVDYTSGSSPTVRYRYDQAGTYYAVLQVRDDQNRVVTDTVAITVITSRPIAIVNIRADTTVLTGDTILFTAAVLDPDGQLSGYAWDFDGDGAAEYQSPTSPTARHSYAGPGTFRAILRVTARNGAITQDTVTITVVPGTLRIAFLSPDTVVEHGAAIRCSVAVEDAIPVRIELDSANTGSFSLLSGFASSGARSFSTGGASSWDSVVVRVIRGPDTLRAGFDVRIQPRVTTIRADSSDSTITIGWTQSLESDFRDYEIYRSFDAAVDTTDSLWARIDQQGVISYTTQPQFAPVPRYYRLYQRDTEGLRCDGSNTVFAVVANSPPTAPRLLVPDSRGDTVLANATIQWQPSKDRNGDSIFYRILFGRDNQNYQEIAGAITDTSYRLTGMDTLSATVNLVVEAYDLRGGLSSHEIRSIVIRPVRLGRMRLVPAGTFVDGSGNSAAVSYSFLMDTTEVTQASYQTVMGRNPSQFRGESRPVEGVTWYDAIAYCNKASLLLGLDTAYVYTDLSGGAVICRWDITAVRLPTEDEWELAARGGKQLVYPTDDGTISCAKANYGPCGTASVEVASYAPNPFTIRDLAGNVAEWCWDRFSSSSPYRTEGRVDYRGSQSPLATSRVVRGGDWSTTELNDLSCGGRTPASPAAGDETVGFRCVIPVF